MNATEFIEKLLSSGYKSYKPNSIINPHATTSYQKRFTDEKGTKYFLNCNYYASTRHPNQDVKDSFEFDIQLYKTFKDREYTMNIKVFSISHYINSQPEFYPLEDIEELVEQLFQEQKFTHYESND